MEASNFPETPAIVNGQLDHGVDYPLVDNNTNTVHGDGTGNRNPVFDCPPGYRFCPSDEELIVDYLLKRATGLPLSVQDRVIDVNLYKYNPEFLSGIFIRIQFCNLILGFSAFLSPFFFFSLLLDKFLLDFLFSCL